jgi:ssDNA-binding Zn-finger/Zn-ribbon topoisomerase 1
MTTSTTKNQTHYECPDCDQPLVRRQGNKGYFWGCSNYPECTATRPDDNGKPGPARVKPIAMGDPCPECNEGERVKRTIRNGQRQGQTFIGCSRFPACHYAEFG